MEEAQRSAKADMIGSGLRLDSRGADGDPVQRVGPSEPLSQHVPPSIGPHSVHESLAHMPTTSGHFIGSIKQVPPSTRLAGDERSVLTFQGHGSKSKGPNALSRLDCNKWITFLFPYCLLLFFSSIFIWSKSEALARATSAAGDALPRFVEVGRETVPLPDLPPLPAFLPEAASAAIGRAVAGILPSAWSSKRSSTTTAAAVEPAADSGISSSSSFLELSTEAHGEDGPAHSLSHSSISMASPLLSVLSLWAHSGLQSIASLGSSSADAAVEDLPSSATAASRSMSHLARFSSRMASGAAFSDYDLSFDDRSSSGVDSEDVDSDYEQQEQQEEVLREIARSVHRRTLSKARNRNRRASLGGAAGTASLGGAASRSTSASSSAAAAEASASAFASLSYAQQFRQLFVSAVLGNYPSDPDLSPWMVRSYPYHVEAIGLALQVFLTVMVFASLILSHVTPPGGWPEVAARIGQGEIRYQQVPACFREWKASAVTGEGAKAAALKASDSASSGAEDVIFHLKLLARLGEHQVAARQQQRMKEGLQSLPVDDASIERHLGEQLHPKLLRVCGECTWAIRSEADNDGDNNGHSIPAPKPDRTHHCRHCETCVLEMDHHCPWVANCIGAYNRKHFLLLLTYAVLSLTVYLVWMAPAFLQALNGGMGQLRLLAVQLFAYFAAILLFGLLFSFWLFHVYLLSAGLTTIEWCEKTGPAKRALAAQEKQEKERRESRLRAGQPADDGEDSDSGADEPALGSNSGKVNGGLGREDTMTLEEPVVVQGRSTMQLATSTVKGNRAGNDDPETLLLQDKGEKGLLGSTSGAQHLKKRFNPLSRSKRSMAVSLTSPFISDDDVSMLPQGKFETLLKRQLYAAGSPYDIAWHTNVASVLGSNPILWVVPADWGVPLRPPYEATARFQELRRRMLKRLLWRQANPELADQMDRAWAGTASTGADVPSKRPIVPA